MKKKEALEIIDAIRHLPKEYLRNPNPYHCCPECQTEFEDSIGDNEKYPSELDLVYEYIMMKIPND
jgi:hypothetical protein